MSIWYSECCGLLLRLHLPYTQLSWDQSSSHTSAFVKHTTHSERTLSTLSSFTIWNVPLPSLVLLRELVSVLTRIMQQGGTQACMMWHYITPTVLLQFHHIWYTVKLLTKDPPRQAHNNYNRPLYKGHFSRSQIRIWFPYSFNAFRKRATFLQRPQQLELYCHQCILCSEVLLC